MSHDAVHPQLEVRFATTFGGAPQCIAFAPGRINLIGEHIDYCGGTVLPMTIQRGTWVAASRAAHGRIRARSDNFHGLFDAALPCKRADADDSPWARYLVGVLNLLAAAGIHVPDGLDIFIAGDLPTGGLSSSASLCVGIAVAVEALAGQQLTGGRAALARLCQRVEHEFAGVHCGIMDQAVIAMSRAGHALALDCRDLACEHVPAPADDPCFVVFDSGKPRALADAPYNARQQEARDAETALVALAGVERLCAIELSAFAELAARANLGDVVRRRALHCVGEQARVLAAINALRARDWHALGALMTASHVSLRDDFEVSCAELDCIVDAACAVPGVYGARLTGAGFGGAAIALADAGAVARLREAVGDAFQPRFGRVPAAFVAHPGGGARILKTNA